MIFNSIQAIKIALKKGLEHLLHVERCPHKLAFSCALAVYIAFCPFMGLHTVLVFLFAWLFKLSPVVLFVVSSAINNPWTMVPVYGVDYMVGEWIFYLLGVDSMSFNPAWVTRFNHFIFQHVGVEGFSLWAFLVGGNLLGILVGGMLYPILVRLFLLKRTSLQRQKEETT